MKAIYHYPAGPEMIARLKGYGALGLDVDVCLESDYERLLDLLKEAEVLWHFLGPADAGVIEAAPKLRLIQKIGVGVNTIALEAAKERGIAVCNMPGTNSRAVAEMTLALMLVTLRRLTHIDRLTRAGNGWPIAPDLYDQFGEICGRTIGLVGCGSIPQILAPILKAMGARVLYTATSAKTESIGDYRDLPDLLKESDIVSLHIPLTPETDKIIDRDGLRSMKPGAILINTARGGLVDEAELIAALNDGYLGAAGLDVHAAEPAPADNPLLKMDNVVVQPHLAWLTGETLERCLSVAVDNCERLRDGRELRFRVV